MQAVKTLEEVQMPQNFIRHPGITALAEALVENPGLRILNLNDNTFTSKGSQAVAAVLPQLQQLTIINFGDCLIRSKGAEYLAKALSAGHTELQEVFMDHGEINLSGAKMLANTFKNKPLLKILDLNGNQFGEDGCDELKELLEKLGFKGALQSLRYLLVLFRDGMNANYKIFTAMMKVNLTVKRRRKKKRKRRKLEVKKKKLKRNLLQSQLRKTLSKLISSISLFRS